jgi:hypothetical protein
VITNPEGRFDVKTRVLGILIAAVTTAGSTAMAQEAPPPPPDPQYQPPAMPEPPAPPQAAAVDYAAAEYAPTPAAPPAPGGQWVYTNQYGWVWMPYGANYTYVAGSSIAYSYAYYPRFGWRWISSPWVVGVGPSPFWGRLGPVHYAWYGHPRFFGYPHVGYYGRPAVYGGGHYAAYHPAYRPAPHVFYGRAGGWRGGWHHH